MYFFSLQSFLFVILSSFHLTAITGEIKLPCYGKYGDMIINFDEKKKAVRLDEVPVSKLKISANKIKFVQNGRDYLLHRNTGILIVDGSNDLGFVRKYQCSSEKSRF